MIVRPVGTKGQCMSYNLNIITTREFLPIKYWLYLILVGSYSPVILVHHQFHDIIMNMNPESMLFWMPTHMTNVIVFSPFLYLQVLWVIIIDLKMTHTVLGYIN